MVWSFTRYSWLHCGWLDGISTKVIAKHIPLCSKKDYGSWNDWGVDMQPHIYESWRLFETKPATSLFIKEHCAADSLTLLYSNLIQYFFFLKLKQMICWALQNKNNTTFVLTSRSWVSFLTSFGSCPRPPAGVCPDLQLIVGEADGWPHLSSISQSLIVVSQQNDNSLRSGICPICCSIPRAYWRGLRGSCMKD